MSDFLTYDALLTTIATGIGLTTPLLLAGLGQTISQRAGILDLGVDAVMTLSAFAAYVVGWRTGNVALAVLMALAVGAIMGSVNAILTVGLHAVQAIVGLGFCLFGVGITDLLFRRLVETPTAGEVAEPLPEMLFGLDLEGVPLLGKLAFSQDIFAYLAFALIPLMAFVINRTTFGLNVRAVGELPRAAHTLGVSVQKTQAQATLIGNVLAGCGGAALALDKGIFEPNLTAGQGFIAIALVYFGSWRPIGTMFGALLYGMVSAMVIEWNTLGVVTGAASSLTAMLPPLVTVGMLVWVGNSRRAPSALAEPFERLL